MPKIKQASGNPIVITDSVTAPLQGLRVYGKTTQSGTPTPEAPVPLVSVGDDGAVDVVVTGKNLCPTSSITTAQSKSGTINLSGFFPSGTYTLSARVTRYADDAAVNARIGIRVNYSDGTYYSKAATSAAMADGVVKLNSVTLVTEATKRIVSFALWTLDYGGTVTSRNAKAEEIQLEIGSTPTAYEPYKGQTLTLSTPNGLPGIPVDSGGNYTDADGQQWICDEVDLARGMYVQRVIKRNTADLTAVFLSNTVTQNGPLYYFNIPDADLKRICGLMSNRTHRVVAFAEIGASVCRFYVTSSGDALCYVSLGADVTDRGTALSVLKGEQADYIYPLAAPIETPLSVDEIVAYRALSTHFPVTTIYEGDGADLTVRYIQAMGQTDTYWTEPKTNWKNGDHFNLDPDYERIKNNILYIQGYASVLYVRAKIESMGHFDVTQHPLASFLNTITENVETLSKSMFLVNPVADMPLHVGNGPGWTADELNDIEKNLLNMYEELNRQYAIMPRLDIKMGIGGINFGS